MSRAPLAKLERYKAKRGWTFPWYSSYGSEFNYDFHVSLDPARGAGRVQLPRRPTSSRRWAPGGCWKAPTEQPGFSAFLTDGGEVFHTYSTFARGMEWTGGSYAFLDLTALGRQEEWEEPKGRADHRPGQRPGLRQLGSEHEPAPLTGRRVPPASGWSGPRPGW